MRALEQAASAEDKSHHSLPFIISCGPKLQDEPDVRTLIRQKAMKNVAMTRKKRGTKHRIDSDTTTLEPIVAIHGPKERFSSSPETVSVDDSPDTPHTENSITRPYDETEILSHWNWFYWENTLMIPSDKRTHERASKQDTPSFSISMPLLTGYEAARAKFQVDITDLSMLTNFNVGKATMTMLSTNPHLLSTLLGHSVWSYLEYIPSHYGPSHCLTTATDCVLAKFQSVVMGQGTQRKADLSLYSKALRSLQSAVQDPLTCMRSDVLCAIHLLSLYELLDSENQDSWSHHVKGFVRLVQHRTARRFLTEFDKALFAAHIGPIVGESLMANTSCYLAEPQWLDLYQSLARPSNRLDDRNPLTIEIRSLMITMTKLWQEVHQIVTSSDLFDDVVMAGMVPRCRKMQDDLCNWMKKYKPHCLGLFDTDDDFQRRELLGVAFECLAVTKRLYATVSDADRHEMEKGAQHMANAILEQQRLPSPKPCWLFLGHESVVANTIVATKEDWEDQTIYSSVHETRLATRRRYLKWNRRIRPGDLKFL